MFDVNNPAIKPLLIQIDALAHKRELWHDGLIGSSILIAVGVVMELIEMVAERVSQRRKLTASEWLYAIALCGTCAVVVGLMGEVYCDLKIQSYDNQIGRCQNRVFQVENDDISASLDNAEAASVRAETAEQNTQRTSESLDVTAKQLQHLARRVTPVMLDVTAIQRLRAALQSCNLREHPKVLIEASGQNNVGEVLYKAAKGAGFDSSTTFISSTGWV
jgi:hypothetical protein